MDVLTHAESGEKALGRRELSLASVACVDLFLLLLLLLRLVPIFSCSTIRVSSFCPPSLSLSLSSSSLLAGQPSAGGPPAPDEPFLIRIQRFFLFGFFSQQVQHWVLTGTSLLCSTSLTSVSLHEPKNSIKHQRFIGSFSVRRAGIVMFDL